jgi:hypothetical protein
VARFIKYLFLYSGASRGDELCDRSSFESFRDMEMESVLGEHVALLCAAEGLQITMKARGSKTTKDDPSIAEPIAYLSAILFLMLLQHTTVRGSVFSR